MRLSSITRFGLANLRIRCGGSEMTPSGVPRLASPRSRFEDWGGGEGSSCVRILGEFFASPHPQKIFRIRGRA